ncbi:MAG: hypothetical protein PHV74_00245 [Dehalococcoidia bacterium]|nr:hypothetical protein [Dehalococcoidia bacterium]
MKKLMFVVLILAVLAVVGVALAQSLLGSMPVNFTVTSNRAIKFYSDEAMTTEITGWYIGDLKRGSSIQHTFVVQNPGEPVDITVQVNGCDYVTVTPSTFHLDSGRYTQCIMAISVPMTAATGDVSANLNFVAAD